MNFSSGNVELPKCLVIVLRERLALTEAHSWPIQGLNVGGELFTAISDDWTGFYDWLRSERGTLLGVGYSPFPETEFLIDLVKHLPYVRVKPPNYLEILWRSTGVLPMPESSCDQEFLYDQVFRSETGTYAIAFATDGLSQADIVAITTAEADWVPV